MSKICPYCKVREIPIRRGNTPKTCCVRECMTKSAIENTKKTRENLKINKKCLECKKEFISNNRKKLYCSKKCIQSGDYKKYRKLKGNIDKSCLICKKQFKTIRPFQKLCGSKECKKDWLSKCKSLRSNYKYLEKERFLTCLTCKNKFKTKTRHRRKYCSKKCERNKYLKGIKNIKCIICKKVFSPKGYQITCSKKCSRERRSIQMRSYRKGEGIKNKAVICVGCKKKYIATSYVQKFCSATCRGKSWAKKHRRMVNGYTVGDKKPCIVCKREFLLNKTANQKFCSKKCSSEYFNDRNRRPKLKINCFVCKKEVITVHKSQKTCGDIKCQRYRDGLYSAKRSGRDNYIPLGSKLKCPCCKKEFKRYHPMVVFCSKECKNEQRKNNFSSFVRKEFIKKRGSLLLQAILKSKGKCSICKIGLKLDNIDIDHILPVKECIKDGMKENKINNINNLQATCVKCNLNKRDKVDNYQRRLL